jgi:hypothetical protein
LGFKDSTNRNPQVVQSDAVPGHIRRYHLSACKCLRLQGKYVVDRIVEI